jgi:hypothetical protein
VESPGVLRGAKCLPRLFEIRLIALQLGTDGAIEGHGVDAHHELSLFAVVCIR